MFKTASWLKKNINNKNIKIIDASWYLPNSKRDNFKEYKFSCIPKAIFFDIDKICDKNTSLPHMVPSSRYFESEVSKLGISRENIIIVYCKEGLLSSPRVWWLFKYFGHKKIFVLNGGFKAWRLSNGRISKGRINLLKNNYKCSRLRDVYLINYNSLILKLKDISTKVIDARPRERFLELEPEPRNNIGKGKIKNSINLPFNIFDINGYIRSKNSLRKILNEVIKSNKFLICSCGSGVSACVIGIALHSIGNKNWCIYDGSWTEFFLKSTD